MKIIEHNADNIKIEDYPVHSAHFITEVRDIEESEKRETPFGYPDNGFYYVDESEAHLAGPFGSLEKAKEARDEYFAQL